MYSANPYGEPVQGGFVPSTYAQEQQQQQQPVPDAAVGVPYQQQHAAGVLYPQQHQQQPQPQYAAYQPGPSFYVPQQPQQHPAGPGLSPSTGFMGAPAEASPACIPMRFVAPPPTGVSRRMQAHAHA